MSEQFSSAGTGHCAYERNAMCEPCLRGEHENCTMFPSCECECDGEAIDYYYMRDPDNQPEDI